MGIDVVVEDENGVASAQVLDPRMYLVSAINLPGLEATVCLRFIDPYGDTVFNQRQLPTLISELGALRGSITDEAIRSQAVRGLEAAKRARWADSIIRDYESNVEHARSTPVREHLDAVVALVRTAQNQVHTYVRFRGD